MHKGINTLPRFLFLNVYAYLLLFVGIGIGVLPLYKYGWLPVIPQAILVFVCLRGSVKIFSSWPDKKRKYEVLMQRNEKQFRPGTFNEFMKAPCGRVLTIVVLKDLGIPEKYKELKKLRGPLLKRLKDNCAPSPTIVRTEEDYQNPISPQKP